MKIRTAELLTDAVDADLAWRKKELATLRLMIEHSRNKPRLLNTALRAGISLLYAHWEGFLKTSSEIYLEFVSRQGLKNSQLADNFLAIIAKKNIQDIANRSRVNQTLDAVNFFRRKMADAAEVPYKNYIKTRSNLSSEVLKDISTTIGVNFTQFETKSTLIDERLVKKRNTIAHGQYLDLKAEDFDEIFAEITGLMELWRNEIENSCITKLYMSDE